MLALGGKQVGRKTGEELGKQAAADFFAEYFVATSVAIVVGSIAGAGFAALIGALIREANNLLNGPKRNEVVLESLISEPFTTGTREILHTLSLDVHSYTDFRNDNLRLNISKLQSALTHAQNLNDNEQRVFILFLIGIAESILPGGLNSSAIRFRTILPLLEEQIDTLNSGIAELNDNYSEQTIKENAVKRQVGFNKFVSKFKYAALIPQVGLTMVAGVALVKAGIKGKEITDIAVARKYLVKRRSLEDTRATFRSASTIRKT